MISFLPWIIAALQLSKKNSFRGNYSRKYGKGVFVVFKSDKSWIELSIIWKPFSIADILWLTFWRNIWRTVFDVVRKMRLRNINEIAKFIFETKFMKKWLSWNPRFRKKKHTRKKPSLKDPSGRILKFQLIFTNQNTYLSNVAWKSWLNRSQTAKKVEWVQENTNQ